jgi:predicted acylesterase/phospholipase RssA
MSETNWSKLVYRDRFLVLSLDGGGVRGVLTSGILSRLEKHLNEHRGDVKPLGERFDLIAGTSIGGIIALGLARGLTAQYLHCVLERGVGDVFPRPRGWLKCFKHWLRAKYSNAELAKLLRRALEDHEVVCLESPRSDSSPDTGENRLTMEDLTRRVLITSVSAWDGKPRFHRTPHMLKNASRADETLVGVALATSAAPTYLPQVDHRDGLKYSDGLIDGGVVCNNPSLVAWIEAQSILRDLAEQDKLDPDFKSKLVSEVPGNEPAMSDASVDVKERRTYSINEGSIKVLSIGTGKQCNPSYAMGRRDRKARGKLGWSTNLWELILDSQAQLTEEQMKFILKNEYLRINPLMRYSVALDDSRAVNRLGNLMDLDETELRAIHKMFPRKSGKDV